MGNSSSQENVFRSSMEAAAQVRTTRESLMRGEDPSDDQKSSREHRGGRRKSEMLTAVREEEDGVAGDVQRRLSTAETEVRRRENTVKTMLSSLRPEQPDLPSVSSYIPQILSEAIFCGHLVTDLDSIAGAIGAAELYGGVAARASEVNSETQFALDYWGVPKPLPIEEMVVSQPEAGICLVDHQQMSQVNPAIDAERIVGVIDHHALQNATIVTDRPIYIDIRPWGSMSTIIAHTFLVIQKRPRKCVAGMLLCAILSDTLNLMGPTTTDWDRMMVAILCEIAGVTDINALVKAQFKAKSKELETLTTEQLCNGDCKVFNFSSSGFSGAVGFAVIETTDDGVILARKEELLEAMKRYKEEANMDVYFLAVVNIVALHSNMLILGPDELSLCQAAFPSAEGLDKAEDGVYHLGGRVSRKKDYIPFITRVINKEGWALTSK